MGERSGVVGEEWFGLFTHDRQLFTHDALSLLEPIPTSRPVILPGIPSHAIRRTSS
jgi:hypothetical protein